MNAATAVRIRRSNHSAAGLGLLLSGLGLATAPQAADFCVSTGNQLQNALEIADSNQQDDVIKIVRGTLISDVNAPGLPVWRFGVTPVDANNSLTLSGGWSAGCAGTTPPSLDPTDTVLDARYWGPGLLVCPNDNTFTFTGDISVSNLTVTRGKSSVSGTAIAAGLTVSFPIAGFSTSLIVDNVFVTAGISGDVSAAASEFSIGTSGFLRLRNSIFYANQMTHNNTMGVRVGATENAVAFVNNNSIYGNVAPGTLPGLSVYGTGTYSNNAVADNTSSTLAPHQFGQFSTASAVGLSLYNNHFETKNFAGTQPFVEQSTTAGDPGWTQADTRMVPNAVSPLRDSGRNNPSGGVPAIDFNGAVRTINGTIDRGAVEAAAPLVTADIFKDQFEN